MAKKVRRNTPHQARPRQRSSSDSTPFRTRVIMAFTGVGVLVFLYVFFGQSTSFPTDITYKKVGTATPYNIQYEAPPQR